MRKKAMITVFSIGMLLYGCGNIALSENLEQSAVEVTETVSIGFPEESSPEPTDISVNTVPDNDVVQGGPYGELSLSIPDGWNYETYPVDSGESIMGMYGIRFYPEDVSNGYIELTYTDSFGVCGTGLAEEKTTVAGQSANIGTYDNHIYWDFISFREAYKGIVALTYFVDDWWEIYSAQVMDILDTLSFDPAIKEGGAYLYSTDSELDTIGLSFSLKNISPAGATLVFHNYDAAAPTGELDTGADFVLEIQKDGTWEEAPIILEGNYAFDGLAYIISPGDTTEIELSWEWLYGTLTPGTYRIKKSVMDFRESGDYDKYTAYAQFILN